MKPAHQSGSALAQALKCKHGHMPYGGVALGATLIQCGSEYDASVRHMPVLHSSAQYGAQYGAPAAFEPCGRSTT